MIAKDQVYDLLTKTFSGDKIIVQDLTGTQDHYKVIVVSDLFTSKSRVQRQQMVNKALIEPLKGPLHALTMETWTVAEYQNFNSQSPKEIVF